MEETSNILQHQEKIERGGKEVRTLAAELRKDRTEEECLRLAHSLFDRPETAVRMVAVFLFGLLAAHSAEALAFLREQVSQDNDWRVQEILAQALDRYCADIGYEPALPTLTAWLQDPRASVRRAAAEGPRIWTTRPYFKEHPDAAIKLLGQLKDDESEYVRKSAGNALRDISRKHKELVRAELKQWDLSNKRILFTYKLAGKFLD